MVLSSNLPHVRCLRGLVKTVPISACCSLTCAMPKRGHASQGFGDRIGGLPHIRDSPQPPRPANYVPPSERNPEDESLAFLPGAKPSSQKPHKTVLGEGQCYAPELSETPLKPVQYMDEDAARVKSTSPYSGRSLVGGSVSDGGDYYHSVATESENLHIVSNGTNEPRSERLGTFHDHRLDPHLLRSDTLFSSKHEFTRLEEVSEERMHVGGAKGPIPRVRQMEIDAQALEKSYGSPEYPELLRTFRKNYGAKAAVSGDEPSGKVKYSSEEEARGLTGEPLDYLRGSSRLQSQLTTGPHAYNPLTVLQRSGAVRYEGYAFPPTVELGKLKSMEDVGKLREAHRGGVIGEVRRSFNALVGRPDPDNYVATADKPMEDTHLVYRTLGLDAVQRRQMRFMLTDFDYADRNTAFHVMMSYPYTDWIHAFYMVLVGWCLYQLQVRYEAFSFYDEYLGLDLRQAPSVKKPFLVGVTVVVMLFVLFQPLLVASIATNRAYRIAMRRPIGPP